ncbi:MAG: hypothetical protein V1731_01055 [Candidatus Aenigmatarchaeota archaeon]
MLMSIEKDVAMKVEAAAGGVAIKLPVCKDLVLDSDGRLLAAYQNGRKIEVLGGMTTAYRFFRKNRFPFFSVEARSEYRYGAVLVDGRPLYRFKGNRMEEIL